MALALRVAPSDEAIKKGLGRGQREALTQNSAEALKQKALI